MERAWDILGSCPPLTPGHCRLVFSLASAGSACLPDSPLSSLTLNFCLFAEALWCVASLCVILFTGLFFLWGLSRSSEVRAGGEASSEQIVAP